MLGNYSYEICEKSRIFMREGTSYVDQGLKHWKGKKKNLFLHEVDSHGQIIYARAFYVVIFVWKFFLDFLRFI